MTEEAAKEMGDYLEGTFTDMHEEPFKSIFKKSEHDEIMEELKEIRKKLDKLDRPCEIPIIPYPYPCPYPTDPNPWNPYPYNPCPPYCREIIWTDGDTGHSSYGNYII